MLGLIVEDDPLGGMDLRDELLSAGYEVAGPACSEDEALALAAERRPDVALVDINLDGQNEGVGIARRLTGLLGVCTLFVSGERDVALANRDAAVGYLPKPYAPTDAVLSVEVAAELSRGGTPPPPTGPKSLEIFGNA